MLCPGTAWGEGRIRLGVAKASVPQGLCFVDVVSEGAILAPGRVWVMLEGSGDVRSHLHAPCFGEVVAVNNDAVASADTESWLVEVESDGLQQGESEWQPV